jgi:hypothetical protein
MEICQRGYRYDDVLFQPLILEGRDVPILSIPHILQWDYSETDATNMSRGRYKLRLCKECKRSLRQGLVPPNSVAAVPLNYFYGRENPYLRRGSNICPELSEDLIESHRHLFAGMSYITRSLLALTKPIITVITVSNWIITC